VGDDDSLREHPVLGVETRDSVAVVRLGGELDLYNADEVRAALGSAAAGNPEYVVVDLAEVEFMDSTALGVFVEAHNSLPNGGLRLAAPQLETRRALLVSGLDRSLNVYDTLDEALA
jgi:anti-anti-sigma factor